MERILSQSKGIGTFKTKEDVKNKIKMLSSFYGSYACSEGVWRILLDIYDEEVTKDFLRVGSINRGGAAVDGRCGVVASAVGFLSYVAGRVTANEDCTRLEYWSKKIHEKFEQEFGSYSCGKLWPEVEKKIENKELVPWTSCVIYEGLLAISDLIYDAYFELKQIKKDETFKIVSQLQKNETLEETVKYVIKRNKEYQEHGFVCSESALRALLDGFSIEWSEKEKQLATVYQKGCFIGDRCGVIEVALAILSYKYGRLDCREKYLKDRMLSTKLHYEVEKKIGSTFCNELTDMKKDVEKDCPYINQVLEVVTVVIFFADDIIANELEDFTKATEGYLY